MIKNELGEEVNTPAVVVWYKRNSPPPVNNVPWQETEFIWLFKKKPGLIWKNLRTHYDIPMLQAGCFAKERFLNVDGSTLHPTQKPLSLIMELLKVEAKSVLDPFSGTGTTLHAAQNYGIKAIGIEQDEMYCKVTTERLSQPPLFGGQLPINALVKGVRKNTEIADQKNT